jgi:biotin operon repressor
VKQAVTTKPEPLLTIREVYEVREQYGNPSESRSAVERGPARRPKGGLSKEAMAELLGRGFSRLVGLGHIDDFYITLDDGREGYFLPLEWGNMLAYFLSYAFDPNNPLLKKDDGRPKHSARKDLMIWKKHLDEIERVRAKLKSEGKKTSNPEIARALGMEYSALTKRIKKGHGLAVALADEMVRLIESPPDGLPQECIHRLSKILKE